MTDYQEKCRESDSADRQKLARMLGMAPAAITVRNGVAQISAMLLLAALEAVEETHYRRGYNFARTGSL